MINRTLTISTCITHKRTSVHHKTSPSGGVRAHGFPDPDYFDNCHGELDGLGVPSAKELNDDGSAK